MGQWSGGRASSRARAVRRWAQAGVLALVLGFLGTLLAWSGAMPAATPGSQPGRAFAAGNVAPADTSTPTATDTATATATATQVAQTPASLTLVSPSSGSGPVGAQLTISGTNWSAGSVALGAVSAGSSCGQTGSWVASFPAGNASGGAFTVSFIWPVSLSDSAYNICAANGSGQVAYVGYRVQSSAPPVLSLSNGSVHVGASVTVTGNNFFTSQPIFINLQTGAGTTRTLGTATADGNGTFSYAYTAIPVDVGSLTVIAVTQQEGQAPPAIQAQANLNVLAALTPTATITLTPSSTKNAPVVVPSGGQQSGGGSGALIVALVAIMALILAVIVGVFAFLLMRRKNDENSPANAGWGSSYGAGGSGAGWSPSYSAPNLPFPDDVTQQAPSGGVGLWDDEPDGPGPDWHGKSYGGTRPRIPTVEMPHGGQPRQPSWPSDSRGYPSEPQQPLTPPTGMMPGASAEGLASGYPQQPSHHGNPWTPSQGQPGMPPGSAVPSWGQPIGGYGQPQAPSFDQPNWGQAGMPHQPSPPSYPQQSQGGHGGFPPSAGTQPYGQPSGYGSAPADPWGQGEEPPAQNPWSNDPWGNPQGNQGQW